MAGQIRSKTILPHVLRFVAVWKTWKNARLGHAFLDKLLLFLGYHHMEMDGAAALFSGHAYLPPRSGAFRLGAAGACRSPASLAASFICSAIGRGLPSRSRPDTSGAGRSS